MSDDRHIPRAASTTPHHTVRRADDVVWRCGPDRVLTLRIGDSAQGSSELFGAAALVWLALDEPASPEELGRRLADAEIEADWLEALEILSERGLVVGDEA
jgi:hypothetical protein